MTILHSLISNTLWRSVAELMSRLTSAAFWILVARYLGPTALGSIAFAVSLFSFFELLSSLGLGSVLTRDVAKKPQAAASYYGHALLIGSASAFGFTALMLLAIWFLQPNTTTAINACIMAIALPLAGIIYFSRSMLIAVEKIIYATYATFIENVFQLAVGWLLLMHGLGAIYVVWLLVVAKAIACVLMVYFTMRKVAAPSWRIGRSSLRYWFAQVPSFLLIAVLNGLFWSMTIIMLTKFSGEHEAGYFSAAFKLVSFFLLFAWAYGQALFPVAAKLTDTTANAELFTKILRKSLKYLFICSLAVAAMLSLLSRQIVLLLYGAEMLPSAFALRWLAWVLVPYAAIPVLAYTLISNHLQRRDLIANFAATVTLFISIGLLVPQWGAMGAAIAMLIGSIIFFLCEYVSVHKLLFPLQLHWHDLWPLTAAGMMSVWLFYTRENHVLMGVVLGTLTYFLILYLSNSINKNEIGLLKRCVTRSGLRMDSHGYCGSKS